jgi:glycosyltransferase involved in cell wall biosynthesis
MTNTDNTSEDIAVVHEHHPMRGGGERVAENIAETLSAPLFSAYATEDGAPDDLDVEYTELFEEKWYRPLLAREYPYKYAVRDLIYMWAWEDIEALQEYGVLVQSGNNPGWYVPHDDQTIVKYVHSTPRTAYDLFHHQGTGLMARLYSKATRSLYEQNLSYPDVYVANSDLVAARIRKYWGISDDQIRVVYPPVDTESYAPRAGTPGKFVTVSRLAGHKRIGTIIEAFTNTPYELDIIGTGPDEDRLRELAVGHENITLHGWVSEAEKREHLESAAGFVFIANNEDFGLAPVEAMAAGTPVVGVDDGFTRYQIRHRENGRLCAANPASVEAAVRELATDGVEWTPADLHVFARENFGLTRWHRELRDAITVACENAAVNPDWTLPDSDTTEQASQALSRPDGGLPDTGGDSS